MTFSALSALTPTSSSAARERSEEHTSELQSRLHLVCRLLLEKKNNLPTALTPPTGASSLDGSDVIRSPRPDRRKRSLYCLPPTATQTPNAPAARPAGPYPVGS